MSSILPGPLLGRRLQHHELIALDALLALVMAGTCAYAAGETGAAGAREPGWVSLAAGLLVGAPLAVRRRWPVAVLAIVVAGSAVTLLTGVIPDYAASPVFTVIACALYTVGADRPRRESVPALAACLVVMGACLAAIVMTSLGAATGPAEVGFAGSVVVVAWVLGRAAQERRAYAARTVAQLTQQAVSDERLRIAREMHDVVAHSMALIAVKAAVGNHVAEARPQEARDALRIIETTSRDALVEIRRTLDALRGAATHLPAPGLDTLAALPEQTAAAGVDLELTVDGADLLPEDVRLSVLRIVQESVTNVVKHAAPARCRAVVTVDPAEVRIDVTDDGRRVPVPATAGHGLIGMRERVSMYGGDFTAGPRTEGGFRVTARLPYGTPRT